MDLPAPLGLPALLHLGSGLPEGLLDEGSPNERSIDKLFLYVPSSLPKVETFSSPFRSRQLSE